MGEHSHNDNFVFEGKKISDSIVIITIMTKVISYFRISSLKPTRDIFLLLWTFDDNEREKGY